MTANSWRPEARHLLRLALPLIAAQLTFMGFGVVDTIMAGRLSPLALAAVALGHSLWMILFVGALGVHAAISPLVAHRVGARRPPAEIGALGRRAVRVSLLFAIPWAASLCLLARPVFGQLGLAEATIDLTARYLYTEAISIPLFGLCFTLRNLIEGTGRSRPILLTGASGLTVKLLGNLLLMPHFGVIGAAWATVMAAAAMVAVYCAQLALLPRLREVRLFDRGAAAAPGAEAEILRLGLPIGFILMAEASLFGVTALLMARFGESVVAAHQVAINFASIMFMVPMGLAMATTVRVGQAAGAGDLAAARLRGQVGIGASVVFSLASAALLRIFPQWITALYTADPAIAEPAITFLRYAALFQLVDGVQATANGALRGLKDTRVPMAITVSAYWLVGMPVGAGLAFGAGLGPSALWWGLVAGLLAAAAGLSLRFARVSRPRGSVLMA